MDAPPSVEVLYTTYRDRVFHFCVTRLQDWHDAEDVTQDVFVRALRTPPTHRDHLDAWLLTIAGHLIADRWRRQRIVTFTPWDRFAGPGRDQNPQGDPWLAALTEWETPESVWRRGDEAARVWHVLAALPPDYQAVLRQTAAGADQAALARQFGRSVSAVKSLRLRAQRAARVAWARTA